MIKEFYNIIMQRCKMKKIFFVLLLIIVSNTYGQQIDMWVKQLESSNDSSKELKKENVIIKYLKYDISTLLLPKSEFLGYIGTDYKRIRIYYNSISKDNKKPEIYNVKGTSLVGKNRCDFEGRIVIKQFREYENMHFGCDDEHKNAGFKAQGLLIGEYQFKENQNQKHSGKFEGIVTVFWLVDKSNNIKIDDIEASYSDNYCNNQYVGTWEAYEKGISKTCNWGELRIPFSGDLDIGAAYFSPNPKYYKLGWEDFEYK
jgi:hypothetical protein